MQQTSLTSPRISPLCLIALFGTCGAFRSAENKCFRTASEQLRTSASAPKRDRKKAEHVQEVFVLGGVKIMPDQIGPLMEQYNAQPKTTKEEQGLEVISGDRNRTLFSSMFQADPTSLDKYGGKDVIEATIGRILEKSRPLGATPEEPCYAQSYALLVASVLWLVLERGLQPHVRRHMVAETITWYCVHLYLQQDISNFFMRSEELIKIEAEGVLSHFSIPTHPQSRGPQLEVMEFIIATAYESMMFTLNPGLSGLKKTITAVECVFKEVKEVSETPAEQEHEQTDGPGMPLTSATRGILGLFRAALIKALGNIYNFAEWLGGLTDKGDGMKILLRHVKKTIVGETNSTDSIESHLCSAIPLYITWPSPLDGTNDLPIHDVVQYIAQFGSIEGMHKLDGERGEDVVTIDLASREPIGKILQMPKQAVRRTDDRKLIDVKVYVRFENKRMTQ